MILRAIHMELKINHKFNNNNVATEMASIASQVVEQMRPIDNVKFEEKITNEIVVAIESSARKAILSELSGFVKILTDNKVLTSAKAKNITIALNERVKGAS